VHRLRRKGTFYEQTSFILVDVFTTRPIGGNPLAVIPNGSRIDPETMQAIAKGFHLSETIFVLPPDDRRAAYRSAFSRQWQNCRWLDTRQMLCQEKCRYPIKVLRA